jgi:hypothetical protein
LYVGLPLLCSLFVFEIRLRLSQTDNIILQLLILGLIFGFMQAWLRANRGVLMELDENAPERRQPHEVRVCQFPAAGPAREAASRIVGKPLLDIPHGELKGVLSTTFEMDAQEPDSLFGARRDAPRTEDILPLDELRTPAHKE